ncbi:MAG: hypothetical protein KA277_11935 [Fusobacteriaceae bacterium]|nr:hypothetical protein [Fusobacteriaceae bacterium]
MLFGKSKNKDVVSTSVSEHSEEQVNIHQHPMICLFDFEKEVKKELERLRFNCTTASFGTNIQVNNKQYEEKLLKLNYDSPSNLHEFDIVMLDMTKNNTENFDQTKHNLKDTKGAKARALLSRYPEQVFDPRPLSINIISDEIKELIKKKSIVIAFCRNENIAEYEFVEITSNRNQVTGTYSYSNFNFYNSVAEHFNKYGKKSLIPKEKSKLSPLLEKHLNRIEYGTIFYHPQIWGNGKYEKNENFIPLLLNEREEIISYAHFIEKSAVLVFPDIKEKAEFISELFKTYLPEIIPDIFPFHGEFGWLNNGEYLLPEEAELLLQKKEIEEKYVKDINNIEESISQLKIKYEFLNDLVSESGEKLVKAVEYYMKWLGFESVVNLDDTNPDVLEEDLQIDYGDRFLVVEIKGLGGTSTDKDCNQISKIRYRRAEQRGKFDVFGLYIVNHQRYMPPKSRINSPFSVNQIKDASLDKRGLLTTYNLYKAYFLIEEDILKKEFVREELFKTGLISLTPNHLKSLGTPTEYFMNGRVAIVNLDGISLNKGDTVIAKKQDTYLKATIESLKVNNKEVDSVDSGEIGVKFNKKLKKNSELFVEKI